MRQRVVQEGGHGELEKAQRAVAAAEARLRREILFAHLAGSSLRAIAETVDLSPESVRTIAREENAKRDDVRRRLERPLPDDDWRRVTETGSPRARERELATRRRLAREWRLSVQELDK